MSILNMITPEKTKQEVIKEIDKQLRALAENREDERYSRFCWLANQVRTWEDFNKHKII